MWTLKNSINFSPQINYSYKLKLLTLNAEPLLKIILIRLLYFYIIFKISNLDSQVWIFELVKTNQDNESINSL